MMKLRRYHFSWLVAMAAGVAMTAMTACSSEKELTETPIVEQPAQPTTKGVKVTVTAGISDGAQTRSAVTEGTDAQGKTTRTLKFTAGDRLYIHGEIYDNYPYNNPDHDPNKVVVETALCGYLDIDNTSIDNDGTTASFSGSLHTYDVYTDEEVAYDFKGADPLAACNYDNNEGYGEPAHAYLVHRDTKAGSYDTGNRDFRYNPEDMFADDVETLMTTALFVMGRYNGSTGFTLSAEKPILNCTLSGLAADHDYTATLTTGSGRGINYNIHTGVDGACAFAISTYSHWSSHRTITIKDGETEVGTIDLGTRELTAKVYNVKRNYGRAAFGKFVDISTLTADFEAQDGDVLTGTLANNVKISIAAGAMATLSGARINDNDAGTGRRWTNGYYAGLTCLGDATIILADGTTNTVRNFDTYYPGIQAAHNTGSDGEYTLTIRGGSLGTGQLIASSDGEGAGIGGGVNIACGNITIEGGTVTANGGGEGAGIGSSARSSCGDITINGGTVTATGDSSYQGGAGIGSGYVGSCGKITISGGSVNATGGKYSAGIGSGGSANNIKTSCGEIEITGGIVTATGGENGAGIGSGRSQGSKPSTCGNIMITLNSGSITATGGTKSAGIGTGYQGTCGDINVFRGIVDAYRNNHNGGDGYCDIGPGVGGTVGSVNVNNQVTTSNGQRYASANGGYRL